MWRARLISINNVEGFLGELLHIFQIRVVNFHGLLGEYTIS
jgi:hypothetical protein